MNSRSKLYAVIMAGGRGERFWPLSTDQLPKPFVPLVGNRTMIQLTVERLLPLIPPERILVSIGEAQQEAAAGQLPELPAQNYIVEPVGRDTSACIGFSAIHLEQRDPEAVMLALPADHFVRDGEAFRRTLQTGLRNLPDVTAIVFGLRPARPEIGYGYIQCRKPNHSTAAWPVIRFVEKPDAATAEEYLRSGDFFWNSGMFLWRNHTVLRLLEEHMPDTYGGLHALRSLIGRPEARSEVARVFASLRRISIDYGVLEKTAGLGLVPADFGWDDIGTWQALQRVFPADGSGNVSLGPFRGFESSGCVSYSDSGTVAAFGVSDLVIVQARGRVLVCPKDRAADLKRLLSILDPDQR